MTLPKITDSIIQQVQSTYTVASKFNTAYLYDICNNVKNVVQSNLFKKYGKINSAWTQQYVAEYNKDEQEDGAKFIRFTLPTPAVTVGDDNSGIMYAGDADGCQNYGLVQSRGELNNFLRHRVTKKLPIILYSDYYLEVYNMPLLKTLLVDFIPTDPLLLPTYNVDYDEYPLCAEGVSMMKALVAQSITNDQAAKPTDDKQDMIDSPTTIK